MKSLLNHLNYKTFFIATTITSLALMGKGMYDSTKKDVVANFEIALGAIIGSFGGGYFLGKEDEKKFNKNTYQTKPEDYQS